MTKRSSTDFFITTDKKLDVSDVLRQLSAINEFPCVILMNNRTLPIASKDELWVLKMGLEVGWDLVLDKWEGGMLKPNKSPPPKPETKPTIEGTL
jgi:hypothetical protein